jgi:hypothetical protein
MSDKRRLVFSIIQFLNREMSSDEMSEDAKESLEVASQCLQTAFAFTAEDLHLEVSKTLEDIFREATQHEPVICEKYAKTSRISISINFNLFSYYKLKKRYSKIFNHVIPKMENGLNV